MYREDLDAAWVVGGAAEALVTKGREVEVALQEEQAT
jgi:hypothetical protein